MPPDSKVRYPHCLEGARACPPEDCGGGRFDPEAFDPVKATKAMKKGLPDWRRMVWQKKGRRMPDFACVHGRREARCRLAPNDQ